MKNAIVYCSQHHGNTKKLLDEIAKHNEVALIDITKNPDADLSEFDRIDFASCIYYFKFQKALLKFAEQHMPQGKPTSFIYTYGTKKNGYADTITAAVKSSMPKSSANSAVLALIPLARSNLSA